MTESMWYWRDSMKQTTQKHVHVKEDSHAPAHSLQYCQIPQFLRLIGIPGAPGNSRRPHGPKISNTFKKITNFVRFWHHLLVVFWVWRASWELLGAPGGPRAPRSPKPSKKYRILVGSAVCPSTLFTYSALVASAFGS